jgi:FtsP/CotA-like multicopper oxidase with cupredoxin domain
MSQRRPSWRSQLQLRAADTLADSPPLAAHLVDLPRLDPTGATHRTFDLSGHTINGQSMAMDGVDRVVVRGSTEVWTIRNVGGIGHSFHVHGVQFQIRQLDGRPPPELSGWKDRIEMPPGRRVDLVLSFSGYADPSTPYMFHCHLSKHEDGGMMGQFLVVAPGQ